jgi:hypothetical protein
MTLLKSGRAPVRHYAGHEGVIKPALPAPRQTNAASSFCPCRVVAYRLIARPCSRRRRARASRSARFSAPELQMKRPTWFGVRLTRRWREMNSNFRFLVGPES